MQSCKSDKLVDIPRILRDQLLQISSKFLQPFSPLLIYQLKLILNREVFVCFLYSKMCRNAHRHENRHRYLKKFRFKFDQFLKMKAFEPDIIHSKNPSELILDWLIFMIDFY